MIKAVIFDVDGVLIDSFEANLKFYQDLMIGTGYTPPTREEFPEIFNLSLEKAIRKLTKSSDENEIKKIWDMGRNRKFKYDSSLLSMYEDAEQTIKLLHSNYVIGIVTSRVSESVFESSQLRDMKQYFNVVVTFQDTKNHKPHPEPLLLACKKLNIESANSVYIGDAQNDIIAAKAAGLKGIFFNKDKCRDADANTSQFKEIPELILSLN